MLSTRARWRHGEAEPLGTALLRWRNAGFCVALKFQRKSFESARSSPRPYIWVKGCPGDCLDITTGVPQIAAGLLQHQVGRVGQIADQTPLPLVCVLSAY